MALRTEGRGFDDVIVAYCSGGECQDSIRLAEKLAMAGFYNIYVYKEGFPDWQKKGRPIDRGLEP